MYLVPRRTGAWEAREAESTPNGPRSRTLATFRTLTPEVVQRVQARSSKHLGEGEIRRAAVRAGAPVELLPADRAAAELLADIGAGRSPRPVLRRLLAEALAGQVEPESSNAQAAAAWIAKSLADRGDALRDLLLLSDRLPAPRRTPSRAPRLTTRAA
jgi:hypothetical protein